MSYGQQGGPVWSPGGPPTPDWSALAADAERRRLRKRWWTIGGSVLAAAAIGGVVALAIVNESDGGGKTTPELPGGSEPLPSDTSRPMPTFEETNLPAPPKPADYISNPDKDTAPFTPDAFFTSPMEIDGRSYKQVATGSNQNCANAVTEELGKVLIQHGCLTLLRATYTGDGHALTIGVAQFPSEDHASAVRQAYTHSLLPLTKGDAPDFCGRGGCRGYVNHVGRYAYFTVVGKADGTPLPDAGTDADKRADRAGLDGDTHAFNLIVRRGEAQASAAASSMISEREAND